MDREPLGHKSRGGRFRETFIVGPEKDHVAKVPRTKVIKKYPFGKVAMPGSAYTLLKFGNINVNKADFANYQALPELVKRNFTPRNRLINGIVVQERVFNYDGSPAVSMNEHLDEFGKIHNQYFWQKTEELKNIFLQEDKPLLGAFYDGSNILVKKVSESEWIPFIVDYKRLGRRSYPFQPNLLIQSELRNKFLRQYARFERKFKA